MKMPQAEITDKDIKLATESRHTMNYIYHDTWMMDRKAAREMAQAAREMRDTVGLSPKLLKALKKLEQRIQVWDAP